MMAAARQAAIVLTTMIVFPSAPIMSSKQEKSAMGIALPPVMTALRAHRILLAGTHKIATQSAYSRPLPPARKAMDAARMDVIIITITIAAPVAAIAS